MVAVTHAHTADVGRDSLGAIRRLLDAAFEGRFGEDDWDHTLGGVHVLVHVRDEIVGHVAVVQRRLLVRDTAIRTGYVEGLAVRSDLRRHGIATAAMAAAERIIAAAYDLGALSDGTGIVGFYQRRGWLTWRGPTWVLAPDGRRRTEDEDGSVLVLPTPSGPELDTADAIACDWRPGDVW